MDDRTLSKRSLTVYQQNSHYMGLGTNTVISGKKIFMMVDLIINIASELLTLLKIIEFLTGLAAILRYQKKVFF